MPLYGTTQSTTKRVTLPIASDGGTSTFNGFTDYAQRSRVALPETTIQWRLRIRNTRVIPATVQTGVLSFTGIYKGTPTYPVGGDWNGDFTATPTQVFGAFVTDTAGAEYTTAWVTDPALQFTRGVEQALDWGFTTTGIGINLSNSSLGGISYWGAGASANVGSATHFGGTSSKSNAFLDVRLEYEFSTPAVGGTPVVVGIGDSILAGYENTTEADGIPPHETWLGMAGMRQRFAWINLGVGGSSAGNWTTSSAWCYTRADLTTTVPDAAVISLGTNDAVGSVTLVNYKANIGSIVAILKGLGIPRIYLATTIPSSMAAGPEALRVSYNTFVATAPWGVHGVIEHAKSLEIAATPALPDTEYSVGTHPQKRGHARMASVVHIG